MLNVLAGVISYVVAGGLLLAYSTCQGRYERERKFRYFIGQLAAAFFLIIAAACMVAACAQDINITDVQKSWGLVLLIGLTIGLFVGAVVVEFHNQPENYSIRRRHIKYALQAMSGATAVLLLTVILLQAYSMTQDRTSISFMNIYCSLFIAALLMASSKSWWKGGRYLVWAYHNSGALKEGGKEMKELRKSLRR